MNFAAPPPDFETAGPLPDVADAFAAHVAREQRRTWTAPSSALRLTPDGKLGALHYPAAALEEQGFRELCVYYNDCFPRATPVLSKLSPPTLAAVWNELFDVCDRRLVKVVEREHTWPGRTGVGERAVFAVVPPSYATDYDVAGIVSDAAEILCRAPVLAVLCYTAASSDVRLVVNLTDYLLSFAATDRYGEEVLAVRVLSLDGEDLGDPLPGHKRRKSVSNDAGPGITIARGMAEKIAAAPGYFNKLVGRK